MESIKASELLKVIRQNNWSAEVEDEWKCYPSIVKTEFDIDEENSLTLRVWYSTPDSSQDDDISLGSIVIDIEGVHFETERTGEGEHGSWEISGRGIQYDGSLSSLDIIKAVEDGDLPEYCQDDYQIDDLSSWFDLKELIDAFEEEPIYVFEDGDGGYIAFDESYEFPEDYKICNPGRVIADLVKNDMVRYEDWAYRQKFYDEKDRSRGDYFCIMRRNPDGGIHNITEQITERYVKMGRGVDGFVDEDDAKMVLAFYLLRGGVPPVENPVEELYVRKGWFEEISSKGKISLYGGDYFVKKVASLDIGYLRVWREASRDECDGFYIMAHNGVARLVYPEY